MALFGDERGVVAMSKMLTVAEVAEQVRASQETVRRWCRAGRLRSVAIGRRVLIPAAELEHLLVRSLADDAPAADVGAQTSGPVISNAMSPYLLNESRGPGYDVPTPARRAPRIIG
jgi:excisionase family DNA binding protein